MWKLLSDIARRITLWIPPCITELSGITAQPKNSTLNTIDIDIQFFQRHPDRKARIRLPEGAQPVRDNQRSVRYLSESQLQFMALGPHDKTRRRIIAWRTEADHPTHPNTIIKIPFLAFADETIEDRDDVLLPIVHQLMMEAAQR